MPYPIDLFLAVPRSGSTILEKTFKNSGHYVRYFHEPNSDVYYQRRALSLPGSDFSKMEYHSYDAFKDAVRLASREGRVLVKDMAYCLYEDLLQDPGFVQEVNIVLLTREPIKAILSHLTQNKDATSEEIGFNRMLDLVNLLKRWEKKFCLIDYSDMVAHPTDTVFTLCSFLGLPFDEKMMEIKPDEDFSQQTAKFSAWHDKANASHAITPQAPQYSVSAEDPRVQELLAAHQGAYASLLLDKTLLSRYRAPSNTHLLGWAGHLAGNSLDKGPATQQNSALKL